MCLLAIINALLIVLFWSFAAVKTDDQTLAENAVNLLRVALVLAEHIGAKPGKHEWTPDWVSATEVSVSSCSGVRETTKQDEAKSSSALLLTVQVYSRTRLQHPEERTLYAAQHKEKVSSTYCPHFDCITHNMYMWNCNTPGYSPVLKSSGELKCQDQEV